jgi:hypothetical protein
MFRFLLGQAFGRNSPQHYSQTAHRTMGIHSRKVVVSLAEEYDA